MVNPRVALERLVEAAESGRLDALCERHDVRLMGVFGSATEPDVPDPHDLDIAAAFESGHRGDVIAVWSALQDLCGPVELDVMDLDRARPVARANGLVGVPLYERRPGEFARAQTVALTERMACASDTRWLRRLDRRRRAG